jgi:HAE1 family hydrophobic/amphiphilic exporter-1
LKIFTGTWKWVKNKVRAYDGTAEIGGTVVSITLVIVVVFLPIALSSGPSNIITQFCVIIISTLLSLVASFTIIPHLLIYGKLEHIEGKTFW